MKDAVKTLRYILWRQQVQSILDEYVHVSSKLLLFVISAFICCRFRKIDGPAGAIIMKLVDYISGTSCVSSYPFYWNYFQKDGHAGLSHILIWRIDFFKLAANSFDLAHDFSIWLRRKILTGHLLYILSEPILLSTEETLARMTKMRHSVRYKAYR